MAAPVPQRPRFALDTNVLIDLAEGLPFAQRFLATYRNAGLAVPPTVIQELVHIATTNHLAQQHAQTALAEIPNLITSDIHLLGINPAQLAQKLNECDLAPVAIFHPRDILR